MKYINALAFASVLLALTISGSALRAATLPLGVGSVSCANNMGGVTDPVSCNEGTDSGLVTYTPFAGVSGSANGLGLVDSAGLFGVLNYSFEVTGGTAGDVVPVDIDTVLQAIPNSIGSVFSEIIVTADTTAMVVICNTGCTDSETGFTGTLKVDALSGTVYTDAVHLEIDVIGALGNSFNGGMASADPFLFIDPTFPNAGDYSVQVSPNIGNIPETVPVPEPAVWEMLLVGFAGLGYVAYRRTRKAFGPRHPVTWRALTR